MTIRGKGLRSVMYFTNWGIYGRNFQPQDLIPMVNEYTHILYSFANVRPESGEVYLTDTYSDLEKHYPTDSWNDVGNNAYGCVKQLFLLKKKYRKMKVLLSIGGWTYSPNFAAPMATEAGRQRFVDSSIRLIEDLGFDGIDIDWEYPTNTEQGNDFAQLLCLLRMSLDSLQNQRRDRHRFLITAAVSAGPTHYKNYNIPEMSKYLDFWNLMAYDYAGSWDQVAGHQANLFEDVSNPSDTPFNTDRAIRFYTENGVKPENLVLGMPLYGRAFENTAGPGKPFHGIGEGSWENGVWDYKSLPKAGCHEHEDSKIGASWSYDQAKQEMISYDTPAIVKTKAAYVKDRSLGGGMWWEASGDKPRGQGNLVETFVNAAGGSGALEQSSNCLSYPNSKYDNIRGGCAGD